MVAALSVRDDFAAPGPLMELRQLESFVAVARHGSFTRAAAELRFDQSTVSRHVGALERDLRLVLLSRSSRDVKLTPCGLAFLPMAKRVLDSAHRAEDLAGQLRGDRAHGVKTGTQGRATDQ